MFCHAELFHYPDSFDNYCARPKVQYLTKEMAVGYECAVCTKLAVKAAETGTGEMKENEKKRSSHAKAKSTDQIVTARTYADRSYLEDEFDAWQVGLTESGLAKGRRRENVKGEASVGRRGGIDGEGRSSSVPPRKGSKDCGSKGDGYTDTKEHAIARTGRSSTFHDCDRSSAPNNSSRRSSSSYTIGRSSTPYGSSRRTGNITGN